MKITFYSSFLTHHQLPFCLEMVKMYGNNFRFVSTIKISEERLKLGYNNMDEDYEFVIKAYESKEEYERAMKLALDSDIVIMGSTITDEYITERLKQDKLTFRYYARIFYKGIFSIFDFKNLKIVYNKHFKYRKNKNLYMLCASSYSPNDFNKLGMYKNKCFKWGYFPDCKKYDIKELLEEKEKNEIPIILWCGRFIKEKHPEYIIRLARKLKEDNYKFKLQVIGNGLLFSKTKQQINKYKLENEIELVGAVESHKVRKYMEKANVFICTSDKNERWGVVLNEAMNSGCALIANRDIGGVPFLIDNNENGIMYSNFRDFYNKTRKVLINDELRKRISKNAYETIITKWTAKEATNNFKELVECIINKHPNTIKQGPGSNAYPVKIKY